MDYVKVKLIAMSAGPEGVKYPGQVYDVSREEAKVLLDGGFAEKFDEPTAPETEPEVQSETSKAKK